MVLLNSDSNYPIVDAGKSYLAYTVAKYDQQQCQEDGTHRLKGPTQ